MARADHTLDGVTRFGGGTGPRSAIHAIAPYASPGSSEAGIADKPGVLMLDAVSDAGVVTTHYLWVDSTGDLRIHNAYPANQDGDGSVVGGQS